MQFKQRSSVHGMDKQVNGKWFPIQIMSFNCKNVKRSLECIRQLCKSADIIALQKTWLKILQSYVASMPTLGGRKRPQLTQGQECYLVGPMVVLHFWNKQNFRSVAVVQCVNSL